MKYEENLWNMMLCCLINLNVFFHVLYFFHVLSFSSFFLTFSWRFACAGGCGCFSFSALSCFPLFSSSSLPPHCLPLQHQRSQERRCCIWFSVWWEVSSEFLFILSLLISFLPASLSASLHHIQQSSPSWRVFFSNATSSPARCSRRVRSKDAKAHLLRGIWRA